jgi:hypothetical protein
LKGIAPTHLKNDQTKGETCGILLQEPILPSRKHADLFWEGERCAMELDGQVAVVTGSAVRVGKALALAFAAELRS